MRIEEILAREGKNCCRPREEGPPRTLCLCIALFQSLIPNRFLMTQAGSAKRKVIFHPSWRLASHDAVCLSAHPLAVLAGDSLSLQGPSAACLMGSLERWFWRVGQSVCGLPVHPKSPTFYRRPLFSTRLLNFGCEPIGQCPMKHLLFPRWRYFLSLPQSHQPTPTFAE